MANIECHLDTTTTNPASVKQPDSVKDSDDSTKILKGSYNKMNTCKSDDFPAKVAYIFSDSLLQWSNFGLKVRQRVSCSRIYLSFFIFHYLILGNFHEISKGNRIIFKSKKQNKTKRHNSISCRLSYIHELFTKYKAYLHNSAPSRL